ncbi:MAG: hypothetical protein U0X93_13905 [Anaerolineales bacterium]
MNVSTPITDHYLLTDPRHLTNGQDAMTLAKSYQPYGETLSSAGNGSSPFAFTGEQADVSGLTYLHAALVESPK